MISVGPCPRWPSGRARSPSRSCGTWTRFCYERQHGADMEVGSYAHRAILHEPEEIPSIDQAKLSPTEMPFTEDDFDPQLEQALELMPELLGAEGAEIRYAINGLLSLTADGAPILGESEVKGLWVCRGGVDQGGAGRRPRCRGVDDRRPFRDRHPPQRHRPLLPPRARRVPTSVPAPARRSTRPTGSSTPASSTSPTAASAGRRWPNSRSRSAPSSSRPSAGSARGGTSPTPASSRSTAMPCMPREHEWDSRWWSPIINAEHLAMRDNAGVIDLTAFAIFDIIGPGALASVQQTCVAQCDVAVGQGDLHPGPRREGWLPVRPHGDAARRGPLPGRHRRRARQGGPPVVQRPACDGRPTGTHSSPTAPRSSPPSGSGARVPATSLAR